MEEQKTRKLPVWCALAFYLFLGIFVLSAPIWILASIFTTDYIGPAHQVVYISPSERTATQPMTVNHKGMSTAWSRSMADRIAQSVVKLEARGSGGTGWFVKPQIIVTNKHVVKNDLSGNTFLTAHYPALSMGRDNRARVIWAHPTLDLAYLEVDNPIGTPLPLAANNELRPGDSILIVGFPWTATWNTPIASAGKFTPNYLHGQMRLQADIQSGNSGSPVVNQAGKVVGVVTSGYSSRTTEPWYDAEMLPVSTIHSSLKKCCAHDFPVYMHDIDKEVRTVSVETSPGN